MSVVLYACGIVAAVCGGGVVLILGYMLCSYIAAAAKGRSSKKWTDYP